MRMVLQYLDICERGYDYDFDEADLYGNIDDEEDDDDEWAMSVWIAVAKGFKFGNNMLELDTLIF